MPVNSLNEVSCGSGNSGNIGATVCGYKLKRPLGLMTMPASVTIPSTAQVSSATFAAWFKTVLQATSYSARGTIIGKFIDGVSNGQEAQFYTDPAGNRSPIRNAVRSVRYELGTDFCYFRQIMAVDLTSHKVLEIWETIGGDVIALGTELVDPSTSISSFAGTRKSLIYAEAPIAPASNEPERYYMQVEDLDINDTTLNRSVMKLSKTFFDEMQIFAVKDVTLQYQPDASPAAGVFKIRPSISCGGKSLSAPDMVPALASPTYVLARNAATGAAITATTVAVDTVDPDKIVVTLDTTDTDYPTTGGFIEIYLAPLATLLTPIGAYEGKVLTVPRS